MWLFWLLLRTATLSPTVLRTVPQAGTIAGSMYGVAKGAYIVPVRVLDSNGAGSIDSLVVGINYVLSDQRSQCSKKVINLSLGLSGKVTAVDRAVAAAVEAGTLIVVAAGEWWQGWLGDTVVRSRSSSTAGTSMCGTCEPHVSCVVNADRILCGA